MSSFALLRYAFLPLTLVSLFLLPWPVTAIGMAASALVFPPSALFIGVLADIVYYPGHGWLIGICTGAILTLAAYAVRHATKVYIM